MRLCVVIVLLLPFTSEALVEEGEPAGFIEIKSTMRDAAVLIDGVRVGRTPLRGPLEVSAGSYTVELSAPGHMTYSRTVEVEEGEKVLVEADLFAFAGVLSLTTNVEGATVRVGPRDLGEAPIVDQEIVAGEHTIRVEAEGYLSSSRQLRVLAGERYDLSVSLVPDPEIEEVVVEAERPPRFKRSWIFWAAAGAVLAGGGAAIFATSGRTEEIYDPSRLPGGEPDAVINPPR